MAELMPIPIDVRVTVEVVGPGDRAPSVSVGAVAAVRGYLEQIDPAALEAEALGRLDETSGNVVAAVLLVLHDHAGEPS